MKKTLENGKLTTKEQIANIALELFAEHGYSAVSIRDICRRVGIKESTVYYHYTNKQAILDGLFARIDEVIRNMEQNFAIAFNRAESISDQEMKEVAVGVMKGYLLNPFVFSMIRMLSIERMNSEKAQAEYRRLVFNLPLEQQEQIFKEMIDRGFIKNNDPRVLAEEYYSIIYMAFQQNCIGYNKETENIDKAKNIEKAETQIRKGIGDLYEKMKNIGRSIQDC